MTDTFSNEIKPGKPWDLFAPDIDRPWDIFGETPDYGYLEPEEGQTTEQIHIETTGENVTVPAGTGRDFAFIQGDALFDDPGPSSSLDEAAAMFEKQAAYIALVANAYGIVADEDVAEFISNRSRALASAQRNQPEYMREFQRQFDDVEGFFGAAGVILGNPRAIGRQAITQAANSSIPLLTTYAGAYGGAAAGGAIGSVAPIVGTAAGAAVGFIGGSVLGAFAGGALVEIGAEIDGMMLEAGVDITNANQVLEALQNEALMKEIKAKAERKGFTTAAVDALFQIVGGRFLRAAKVRGASKTGKVVAGGSDVLIQSVGEGVGEAAGQFAKDGEVSVKEAVLEAVISIGQSAGQTAIGAAVPSIKKKTDVDVGVPDDLGAINFDQFIKDLAQEISPDEIAAKKVAVEKMQKADTSGLNDADRQVLQQEIDARLTEIQNLESAVAAGVEEIAAQEGTNFLPVPKRPETLAQFLKKQGGLKTDTGEAQRFTRKETPALKGLASKNGTLSLEEALELAIEHGFIEDAKFEGGEAFASVNDLIDALESEASGTDIVRVDDFDALLNREAVLDFNAARDEANFILMENVKAVKSFKAAFKKGVRAAIKDVKSAQAAIIDLLKSSPLGLKDRGKFIDTIKNVQTHEQLRKVAPKILNRIERLLGAESLRNEKTKLENILSKKSIGTTVQGKKVVGKFDAPTQDRLDELSELRALTKEQASAELERRLSVQSTDALANRILSIRSDPSNISSEFVADTVAEIEAIKQFGLEMAELRMNTLRFQASEIVFEIEAFTDRNGKIDTKKVNYPILKSFRQNSRQAIARLVESWDDLIDRVAPQATADKLDVTANVQQQKGITRRMGDKMTNAVREAYGINDTKKALNFLDDSGQVFDLGLFINLKGEEVRIEISRSQARKLWMEYQNTDLRENTLQSENGNAYTDEMLTAMFTILHKEDYIFIEKQLEIYEDFYFEINEVYSRVFGVNLPKIEFYSPISRDINTFDSNNDVFLRDINFRRALASGSAIKMRDQNAVAPLNLKSDIGVFNSHIAEMSHFIAFREKTQIIDRVFGDATLRRKIRKAHGKDFLKHIDDEKASIAGMGIATANILDKAINFLNRNFATSVLGLKSKIGMSQLSSYFAYAETIPVADFISGTRDFILNYKKAIQILGDTDFMKNRGYSPDVDIARMGETFSNKFLQKVQRKKDNLIDYTLIFIRMGDRAAIYFGGWAVYKHAIDNGATHEEAILAFVKQSTRTQQSTDVDKMSILQKDKPIIRSLTMFMSAPIAQYRGEVRAFRKFFVKKEISGVDFAKRLLIYHILIPQFFQAISNGLFFGEWDEDDQWRALILGSLNGIPIIGGLINSVFRKIQGKRNSEVGLFKWTRDIEDFFEEAYEALMDGTEGDFEDMVEILMSMSKNAGALLTGLPVPQAEQFIEGAGNFQEGDTKAGVMRFHGFPDSVADAASKGESGVSNPF